ncbi:MAG: cytochrome c maturation protein CcmE [Terricaulis sp.]|nr:cytochrome c maturation protein CcmE [Terricaulis sp.]
MRRRDQRLILIAAAGAILVLAISLTFFGLRDSVTYFVAPSDLAEKAAPGRMLRLGGLVVEGTVTPRGDDGVIAFDVTDGATVVRVHYDGLLPDLFREGQGVVAEGRWSPGEPFKADRVLARHDETYMPREVAEAIKNRGEWKGESP